MMLKKISLMLNHNSTGLEGQRSDVLKVPSDNLGTPRSNFGCWITRDYLSSGASSFGQISHEVAR